jgi:hypothetical protein
MAYRYKKKCFLTIGICVFGKEYFFGGGVQIMDAGRTPYGTPVKYEKYNSRFN